MLSLLLTPRCIWQLSSLSAAGLGSMLLIGAMASSALAQDGSRQTRAGYGEGDDSVKATSSEASVDALRSLFESKSFTSKDLDGAAPLAYRLLRPRQVTAGQTYPLVIFLHGAGERGSDNEAQLKHSVHEFARADRQAAHPSFVIAPQCPQGAKWVEIDWSLESGEGTFDQAASPSLDAVMQLVQSMLKTEPIDPTRVYVTGLSMGGYGSWYAAAKWPDRFAAAMPVCGGGDPDWAARYAGVAVWALHGRDDQAVPVGRSREMIAALAQAGHAPEVRYTEYPGVPHDSWTRTYTRDDVFDWLFIQQR